MVCLWNWCSQEYLGTLAKREKDLHSDAREYRDATHDVTSRTTRDTRGCFGGMALVTVTQAVTGAER